MARSSSPSISVSRPRSRRSETDCTVVWVRGEHDIATQDSLAVAIACAAELDDLPLVVDLGGVTFIDASIIGVLVGSRDRLRSRLQTLQVRAPSPPALRLLEVCGLGHLVQRGPSTASGQRTRLVHRSCAEGRRASDQRRALPQSPPERATAGRARAGPGPPRSSSRKQPPPWK